MDLVTGTDPSLTASVSPMVGAVVAVVCLVVAAVAAVVPRPAIEQLVRRLSGRGAGRGLGELPDAEEPDRALAARLAAAGAVAALAIAGLDHVVEKSRDAQARVAVVATGDRTAATAFSAARAARGGLQVFEPNSASAESLSARLAAAVVARSQREAPREVVLLWAPDDETTSGRERGPPPRALMVSPEGGAAAPGASREDRLSPSLRLVSVARALDFEPERVFDPRFLRAPASRRPTALEIGLRLPDAAWRRGPTVSLRIDHLPDREAMFEHEASTDELLTDEPLRWTPQRAGPAELAITLRFHDGVTVHAHAPFRVDPVDREPLVHVLARAEQRPEAVTLANALNAQDLRVEIVDAFGPFDDGAATSPAAVVALTRLDDSTQQALARYVDDGGGLLLVGGAGDHGALPRPGEPLHALLPVACPAPAPPVDGAGEGDGAEADPSGPTDERPPADPDPDPTPSDPDPDPDQAPADDEPRAGAGDVSDATQPEIDDRADENVPITRRAVALVLVIDRSASMRVDPVGVGSRMDFAKSAAFETARRLDDADRLGIVTFGADAEVLRPIQSLGQYAAFDLEKLLESIRATGHSTNLHTGISRAQSMLEREGETAAIRHIVCITDGALSAAVQALSESNALAANRAGITVSIVHIRDAETGPMLSPGMRRIAETHGGGSYHSTHDAQRVPALVVADVLRVSGRGPSDGLGGTGGGPGGTDPASDPRGLEPDTPDQTPPDPTQPDPGAVVEPPETTPPTDGTDEPPQTDPVDDLPSPDVPIDTGPLRVRALVESVLLQPEPVDGEYPAVSGMVGVRARTGGRVLLVAGADGLPLLAFGHHGLGKMAVWTSDLTGAWSSAWRDDPAFPARLAQWVTSLQTSFFDGSLEDPARALREPARSDFAHAIRLVDWTIEPARPTPTAIAALSRRTGGAAPASIDGYEPPANGTRVVRVGSATDLAWGGIGLMLALALLERLLRERT